MRKHLLQLALIALCPILAAQQAMNNDSVVKLVKAGLSDDIIITTINSSPGSYDTTANGIIALKEAGASDKVISAVLTKATGAAPGAAATPSGTAATAVAGLPAGITDVGVYYKDKTGAWQAMFPEIVNFKTGGVLKSFATGGIVKGDVNGHVNGPKGKYDVTFPITLAVYVPEGTDITEYQLLRLRTNSDSREFRSVTGGVMHVSGGATRDMVEYQPQKIADRVYQITLLPGLGKGEYGLLPPGAYGSSNMGSNGKIYTLSVLE